MTFVRSDSLPARRKRDLDDVKKLVTQLRRFDVFRLATTTSAAGGAEENTDADTECRHSPGLTGKQEHNTK